MKKSVTHLVVLPLLVLALLGGAAGLALAGPSSGPSSSPPARGARPVVVDVTGDAANGFEISYADGSQAFPPTDSESMAECGEYDTLRQRVRCRTEVRTWYRDLGDLQRSLAWVREHG
ncbi:hypothetical protein [Nocardioides sp. 1609]|uniref:hypothetical protein n=1 Tax=Nocardioides sp. 1609 TaxID=2508327 RepID=UPI00106F2302|nr:hypothetical protein [Nocardioides sp. 1609]